MRDRRDRPTVDRIAAVTTYAVDYPLDAPMADAVHYIPSRAALLVEVTTESGRVGIGESAIYGGSPGTTEALDPRGARAPRAR